MTKQTGIRQSPSILLSSEEAESLGLNSAASLFRDSTSLGYRAKIVLSRENQEIKDSLDRRRHDIKSAVRTLAMAVDAIVGGYRFTDERAGSKIKSMEKAVRLLESESVLLDALLKV